MSNTDIPVYDASDVRHVTRYQKISNVKCAQISYEQIHKNTSFSYKALKQHRAENDSGVKNSPQVNL